MRVNDALLTDRLSAELAVDQALNPVERAAFRKHILVGPYDGAEPADWIAEAIDRDANLDIIEPWMDEHGDKMAAVLRLCVPLPEEVATQILVAALHAKIVLGNVLPGTDHRRMAVEIAGDAMLWARGYAFGIGWTPEETDRD